MRTFFRQKVQIFFCLRKVFLRSEGSHWDTFGSSNSFWFFLSHSEALNCLRKSLIFLVLRVFAGCFYTYSCGHEQIIVRSIELSFWNWDVMQAIFYDVDNDEQISEEEIIWPPFFCFFRLCFFEIWIFIKCVSFVTAFSKLLVHLLFSLAYNFFVSHQKIHRVEIFPNYSFSD